MGQTLSDIVEPWLEYFFVERVKRMMAKIKPEDCQQWDTYEYEGVALYPDVLRSTMDDMKTLEIREDDVFIVTYPKTGTTWTQEIMSCILNDGNIQKVNKRHTILRVPFLEMTIGGTVHKDLPKVHKMVDRLPRHTPRHIKTHLPGQLLPPQVWEKRVKMVYVLRNPKDVAASYYHHCQMMNPQRQLDWDDFFQRFHDGTIGYGKWWEHYLYFWEKRHEDHILLLRFEDAKKDLRGTVKQISAFLGKTFTDDVIDDITEHCTFGNMKNNPMANPDTMIQQWFGKHEGRSFMRKGTVGDWKGHLSAAQSEAIDALCKEMLTGAGLTFN